MFHFIFQVISVGLVKPAQLVPENVRLVYSCAIPIIFLTNISKLRRFNFIYLYIIIVVLFYYIPGYFGLTGQVIDTCSGHCNAGELNI